MTPPSQRPTVSLIVPGLNCAATLPACLSAIQASSIFPDEVIFFDDGSSDNSGDLARAAGAEVLRNDGAPLGPGMARNHAAEQCSGDILVFVDSDVAVHQDAIQQLVEAIGNPRYPATVAAFGSYDDMPPARNLASLYMNLRHHAVHQQGAPWAATFWAGLGAVRRDAFMAAGGFHGRYNRPSIEDIELGTRLIASGGRIRLVHEAQAAHYKRWSLMQVWRTDIFHRAIPWSRLIAEQRRAPADLNASAGERSAAVLAHLLVLLLAASLLYPPLLLLAGAAFAAYLVQNRRVLAVMARRAPWYLMPPIVMMHLAYHIYASQIFGWTLAMRRLPGRRPRTAQAGR